jgi:outer membrane immunogenic protein
MKRFTLFFALFVIFSGLLAQNRGVAPLARGEKQINFGAGIYQKGIPAYFSVDFALHKDVTLTPEIHAVFPFPDKKFKGGVMVKADYHWNYLIGIPANWDFYAGARAGFSFGGNDFYPDLGIQAGGRWYWSSNWGLNLELAVGTGFGITFGLSVKL